MADLLNGFEFPTEALAVFLFRRDFEHLTLSMAVATPADGQTVLVDFRQLELDFPVFEYVPPRAFATTLALAAQVQLGFSVQLAPTAWLPQQNNAPYTGLGASWFVYLRLRLDARKYFGGSPEDNWGN